MDRLVVFKTSSRGRYQVKAFPANASVKEIEKGLPPNISWFGTDTKITNPEDAVKAAKAGGYKYRSPQEMKALHSKVRETRGEVLRVQNPDIASGYVM